MGWSAGAEVVILAPKLNWLHLSPDGGHRDGDTLEHKALAIIINDRLKRQILNIPALGLVNYYFLSSGAGF